MTKERDFKRLVRDRAARTGESYQTARRQLRPTATTATDDGISDDLADEFEQTGIVKLTGVFSEASAALMRDAVWQGWADAYGVREDDPTTWRAVRWKTVKAAKRHPAFRDILGDSLRSLADRLIGPGWSSSKGLGNLLTSFPDTTQWHLPGADGNWHCDYGFAVPMDPVRALRVFALFGDVPPGGGGTLLVAGSHRMVERFVRARPEIAAGRAKAARAACNASNEWLRDLTEGDGHAAGRADRFMATTTDVDGIAARVLEAHGEPGDVYVCHPWTIHCPPPNANTAPRFIRSPTLAHRSACEPPEAE